MSAIQQPVPQEQTRSSTRLLSSHHSVLEMLQREDSSDGNITSEEATQSSTEYDRALDLAPWQFIDSMELPRPTSSVLSSSDTEEEYDPMPPARGIPLPPSPSSTTSTTAATATATGMAGSAVSRNPMGNSRVDDETTIVVNLNELALHQRTAFEQTPVDVSLVLPDFSMAAEDRPHQQYQGVVDVQRRLQDRVLIIGHRKVNLYKSLSPMLRDRFTLDSTSSNYKIVVVIFDGLTKIGNILNFIKANDVENKLFVPVVRNISYKIIERLLTLYKIQLLCMPIQLDDEESLKNLLDLISDDVILEDSFKTVAHSMVDDKRAPRLLTDEPSNQSISMTHDFESYMQRSKKLQRRKKKRFTYSLVGIGISVGIGIGITIAIAMSYFRSFDSTKSAVSTVDTSPTPKSLRQTWKLFSRSGEVFTNEALKGQIFRFKQLLTKLSQTLTQQSSHCSNELKSTIGAFWNDSRDSVDYLQLLDI